MPAQFNTTSLTKRKKLKFKSAEEKRRSEMLDKSWENLKRKYDVTPTKSVSTYDTYTPQRSSPPRGESQHYPSRDSGGRANATLKPSPVYTGTKIIGIGTLHKSNAVPVFSNEEALDIAKMRRG
jgi:hypothetical protein